MIFVRPLPEDTSSSSPPDLHLHTTLFVYGTLKSGYMNCHHFFESRGAQLIGPAITLRGYDLIEEGRSPPWMVLGERRVVGQVWRVPIPSLGSLDYLERGYTRVPIKVALQPDGTVMETQAYILQDEYVDGEDSLVSWEIDEDTHTWRTDGPKSENSE